MQHKERKEDKWKKFEMQRNTRKGKQNETKRNETKRSETKGKETKRN